MDKQTKNLYATFDIMLDGHFKGQINIPVVPLFEYPQRYYRKYVEKQRPYLAGKPFTLQPAFIKVFR